MCLIIAKGPKERSNLVHTKQKCCFFPSISSRKGHQLAAISMAFKFKEYKYITHVSTIIGLWLGLVPIMMFLFLKISSTYMDVTFRDHIVPCHQLYLCLFIYEFLKRSFSNLQFFMYTQNQLQIRSTPTLYFRFHSPVILLQVKWQGPKQGLVQFPQIATRRRQPLSGMRGS